MTVIIKLGKEINKGNFISFIVFESKKKVYVFSWMIKNH